MAINHDITVDQGKVHVEEFILEVLTDPELPYDVTTNPYIPLDITTAAIQCQVRQTYNSNTVLLTATDLNGRFVKTDATNGLLKLTINPADTLSFPAFNAKSQSFPYDIQLNFSPTNIMLIASGQFIINRAVTRITV